ncbi:proline-rich protein 3-like [Actinidia eriantha]|uniref:proline-rich protein 3-like n=1 Tax=Actinidia eriantha TaxID=165200 RepID=UPI00258EA44E|nr:proline-rich protein 3-like [Actinidia eriantha]
MAITPFSSFISILLLSLVVVASATGYDYAPKSDGYSPKSEVEKPNTNGYGVDLKLDVEMPKSNNYGPGYIPKPEVEKSKTNGYGYAPKPKVEKPKTNGYGYTPKLEVEKPKTNDYEYAPKLDVEKPKTNGYGDAPEPKVEKPKTNGYGDALKPEVEKPKTNGYEYVLKPEVEKLKKNSYEYTTKLEAEKPKTDGYGDAPKPKIEKLKTKGYGYAPKSELEKSKTLAKLLLCTTGIQGLIYCKSGAKLIPLEGALARITCLAKDKNGYESAPFSVLSHPTDAKGYFLATVSPSELKDACKLTECKAFLEKSPLESCNVPTDVNNGIRGASLSPYHLLEDKNMKLSSVGPFVYTPKPKPVSNGY